MSLFVENYKNLPLYHYLQNYGLKLFIL